MITAEMIENTAKAIAFAGRDQNDISADAEEFWKYTSEGGRARYRTMANAALALLPVEPVAWRWSFDNEDWYFGRDNPKSFRFVEPTAIQPLYTFPSPESTVSIPEIDPRPIQAAAVDRDELLEEARAIATKIIRRKASLALTTGDGQPYAKITFSEQEGLRSFTDGMIELRAFLFKLEASHAV